MTQMTISDAAVDLVKSCEGCVLHAYPDPGTDGDPWTVGYGHTGPEVKPGYVVDQDQADADLRADMQSAADGVNAAVSVSLAQNQFDALVSFVFNVGQRNFQNSTLLRELNFGQYAKAADQFLVWNKGGGGVLPGLVKRRAAERALFLGPALGGALA